jgi:hypothetical protein
LVHGGAEVVVVRQPAGDHEIAFTRSAGDWCGAGVALQTSRVVELADVFADLARDPGGEQIPEPGHAPVDLTARERLPRVGILHGVLAAAAPPAQQQLGHPGLPAAAGLVQCQQLPGSQPDTGGLGPHQVVAGVQRRGDQRGADLLGEPPMRVIKACELLIDNEASVTQISKAVATGARRISSTSSRPVRMTPRRLQ